MKQQLLWNKEQQREALCNGNKSHTHELWEKHRKRKRRDAKNNHLHFTDSSRASPRCLSHCKLDFVSNTQDLEAGLLYNFSGSKSAFHVGLLAPPDPMQLESELGIQCMPLLASSTCQGTKLCFSYVHVLWFSSTSPVGLPHAPEHTMLIPLAMPLFTVLSPLIQIQPFL